MHIPDGFLDTKTSIAASVLSLGGLGAALRRARTLTREVPMIGLASAFVFAAQMINFPIAGGTSGHLLGAVLVTVLLGPSAAVLVMVTVLVVQALLFADGGVLALGANIFNMAIVGPFAGWMIYSLVLKILGGERGFYTAAAFAAWCSTVLAAVVCSGELAWSGTAPWSAVFTAMVNIHMLIGIGEAVITVLVLRAIAMIRPDRIGRRNDSVITEPGLLFYGLIVVLGLLLFVVPFASSWPDGLERAAATLGFAQRAFRQPAVSSPLAEYSVPGIGSPVTATVLAGAIGTVVVFFLSIILARIVTRKQRHPFEHSSAA